MSIVVKCPKGHYKEEYPDHSYCGNINPTQCPTCGTPMEMYAKADWLEGGVPD